MPKAAFASSAVANTPRISGESIGVHDINQAFSSESTLVPRSSSDSTLVYILTLVRLSQPSNALAPKMRRLLGNEMLLNVTM